MTASTRLTRCRMLLAPALLLLTFAASPAASVQNCPALATEWQNPASGNWGDAANWAAGVPNNSLNACIITPDA